MPATAIAKVGEREVTVRELTVKEVRNWVAEIEAGAVADPLRRLLFDDCSLDDILRMVVDPDAEFLEGFGESDLAELHAKAKAINPYFFRVREALISVSRIMTAEAGVLGSTGS